MVEVETCEGTVYLHIGQGNMQGDGIAGMQFIRIFKEVTTMVCEEINESRPETIIGIECQVTGGSLCANMTQFADDIHQRRLASSAR